MRLCWIGQVKNTNSKKTRFVGVVCLLNPYYHKRKSHLFYFPFPPHQTNNWKKAKRNEIEEKEKQENICVFISITITVSFHLSLTLVFLWVNMPIYWISCFCAFYWNQSSLLCCFLAQFQQISLLGASVMLILESYIKILCGFFWELLFMPISRN